ncbi:MAG TPA: hypothetical protein QF353_02670 [Gammaproteobacteria bacterium]|nr:hypothetical protein [Gammaproteobacteria bacterium]
MYTAISKITFDQGMYLLREYEKITPEMISEAITNALDPFSFRIGDSTLDSLVSKLSFMNNRNPYSHDIIIRFSEDYYGQPHSDKNKTNIFKYLQDLVKRMKSPFTEKMASIPDSYWQKEAMSRNPSPTFTVHRPKVLRKNKQDIEDIKNQLKNVVKKDESARKAALMAVAKFLDTDLHFMGYYGITEAINRVQIEISGKTLAWGITFEGEKNSHPDLVAIVKGVKKLVKKLTLEDISQRSLSPPKDGLLGPCLDKIKITDKDLLTPSLDPVNNKLTLRLQQLGIVLVKNEYPYSNSPNDSFKNFVVDRYIYGEYFLLKIKNKTRKKYETKIDFRRLSRQLARDINTAAAKKIIKKPLDELNSILSTLKASSTRAESLIALASFLETTEESIIDIGLKEVLSKINILLPNESYVFYHPKMSLEQLLCENERQEVIKGLEHFAPLYEVVKLYENKVIERHSISQVLNLFKNSHKKRYWGRLDIVEPSPEERSYFKRVVNAKPTDKTPPLLQSFQTELNFVRWFHLLKEENLSFYADRGPYYKFICHLKKLSQSPFYRTTLFILEYWHKWIDLLTFIDNKTKPYRQQAYNSSAHAFTQYVSKPYHRDCVATKTFAIKARGYLKDLLIPAKKTFSQYIGTPAYQTYLSLLSTWRSSSLYALSVSFNPDPSCCFSTNPQDQHPPPHVQQPVAKQPLKTILWQEKGDVVAEFFENLLLIPHEESFILKDKEENSAVCKLSTTIDGSNYIALPKGLFEDGKTTRLVFSQESNDLYTKIFLAFTQFNVENPGSCLRS